MRVLGHGTASLEGMPAEAASSDAAAGEPAAAGPSIFVPAAEVQAPEEDMRVIDASRLTVMQAVEVEQDAAVMAGGVTAFSRERERERVRGTCERSCHKLPLGLLC
jgi:alpha-L-fucosidase